MAMPMAAPADAHAVAFETQSGHFWYDARNALIAWALGRHFPGAQSFFERKEVKDVIAYFKLIAHPPDEVSLMRIVYVPARGFGDTTMERLHQEVRGLDDLPAVVLEQLRDDADTRAPEDLVRALRHLDGTSS